MAKPRFFVMTSGQYLSKDHPYSEIRNDFVLVKNYWRLHDPPLHLYRTPAVINCSADYFWRAARKALRGTEYENQITAYLLGRKDA
jgi:hypothetical protein